MSERLMASDPEYEELNRTQMMLVYLKNRQIANRYGNRDQEIVVGMLMGNDGEAEINATEQAVLKALESQLNEVQKNSLRSVWGEFVEGLEL